MKRTLLMLISLYMDLANANAQATHRYDVDVDGHVNIMDVITLVNYILG